mgnify:CR=1 FL=1
MNKHYLTENLYKARVTYYTPSGDFDDCDYDPSLEQTKVYKTLVYNYNGIYIDVLNRENILNKNTYSRFEEPAISPDGNIYTLDINSLKPVLRNQSYAKRLIHERKHA